MLIKTLLRRLIALPFVVIGVYMLGFAYALIARGVSFADSPFGAQIVPQPVAETTLAQLGSLARLDFGTSPDGRGSVAGVVFAATLNSLGLLAVAFSLSVLLGMLFGFLAVKWNPPGLARWLLPATTVSVAMPSFYVGILLMAALLRLPGAPLPVQGFGWDAHLVLPVIALMLRPTFQIAQIVAGTMAGQAGRQYVVAARSVGNSWRTIQRRHILRNVLAPVILYVAGMFRLMVAELMVVEWLFNWPGLGRLLAGCLIVPTGTDPGNRMLASFYLDPNTLGLAFAVLAVLFFFADLIATLCAQWSDPRLRSAAVVREQRGIAQEAA